MPLEEGPVFGDIMVLAGVAEAAELTWRDAFDEEHDTWTKAAHRAVKQGDYGDLDEARDDNFAVWLVPVPIQTCSTTKTPDPARLYEGSALVGIVV
jgi:hypothetical protein